MLKFNWIDINVALKMVSVWLNFLFYSCNHEDSAGSNSKECL